MLPLLWPFMDIPNSFRQVCHGCPTLASFLGLCVLGYLLQNFAQFLRLDRFLSFHAPCMKKGEFWRLFTYFALHGDLQHICANLFHLLDTLDLEGVPEVEVSAGVGLRCARDGLATSVCYPDIGIGSQHTMALIALVLAYGALVGTICNFGALVQGASSVCFGVDGALIALYAMFLGAGLDAQLSMPDFGKFFWMRIGLIAFHIFIDLAQTLCGSGKDTVGTVAHIASLVAGFCYMVLVLPPIGDSSLFDIARPYIVSCGMTSPRYVTTDRATAECIAFFSKTNGMEVGRAKLIAALILGGGVFASMVNAFLKRHITDDGIACWTCGEKPQHMVDVVASRSRDTRAVTEKLRNDVANLERLYANMPDPEALSGRA